MQGVPGFGQVVILVQPGLLGGGLQGVLEGVMIGGHPGHPWIIDGDAVVERLLGGLDTVGLRPQFGAHGQEDETVGLASRAERAEDPLGDQQGVQIGLTKGTFRQILQAVGDEVG
ncbi:MAG TPA: hypothetical protein VN408_35630 [Actinoplanes sp.]|nr:hypothetical protein [Actinoplanes sp.]